MSNIVMIASGSAMASYGEQLKNSISCPHRLIIANVWMEDAVNYAKYHLPEDTDVIMARGNTAKLLKEARLPVPVVSIPISDAELIRTLETARQLYHAEDSSIAYIGIEDTIHSVRSFLTLLHRSIRFYAVKSSQDIRDSIRQAKKDHVNVVIGGVYTRQAAKEAGLSCVLLESSLSSVREAYERALEVQKGVLQQKRRFQEHLTVIHSISDGIISINEKGLITLVNRSAESLLKLSAKRLTGKPCSSFLSDPEQGLVNRTLISGTSVSGHICRVAEKDCAISVHPILVGKHSKGAILTLRPLSALPEASAPGPASSESSDGSLDAVLPRPLTLSRLKGSHPAFANTLAAAGLCTSSSMPVLLIGQSGTGRRTLARCIHNGSSRKNHLFLSVDASLLQTSDFLSAHMGSLFIHETGNLSPEMAVRLEEFLKTGLLTLENGERTAPDVRIFASTSCPLNGKLPVSLCCILEALSLSLPSLSSRGRDVGLLADCFLEQYGKEFHRTCTLSPDGREYLQSLPWPGNLTQLQSLCRKLSCFAPEDGMITSSFIRRAADQESCYGVLTGQLPNPPEKTVLLNGRPVTLQQLKDLETLCHGRRKLMAQQLGVSRSTLWRCLKDLEEQA